MGTRKEGKKKGDEWNEVRKEGKRGGGAEEGIKEIRIKEEKEG